MVIIFHSASSAQMENLQKAQNLFLGSIIGPRKTTQILSLHAEVDFPFLHRRPEFLICNT